MLGISGPSSVNEGDVITLTCRYDLGRDAIYSMKWFKGDQEVYRYIPTDTPEFKHFDAPGIEIESASTRPNLLVMKVIGPLASGEYRCEITVETPSFVTLQRTHNLTVIVPPRLAPAITGIDTYYQPGDLVEITCTSKDSKPAPTLLWTLNGKQAPEGYQLPFRKSLDETTGLESAEKGLRFTAENVHFPEGELRLQCIAEIEGVWKTHVEGVALGGGKDGERNAPNRLLVRNAGCSVRAFCESAFLSGLSLYMCVHVILSKLIYFC